jgi:hypothetical protein
MKRQSTLDKIELIKKLNWLERKNKRNTSWDSQVKLAFAVSGSFSFEEMVMKDKDMAQTLIENFN